MSAIDAMYELRQRLETLTRDGRRYEGQLAEAQDGVVRAKDVLRQCYELQDSYFETLARLGVPLTPQDKASRVAL